MSRVAREAQTGTALDSDVDKTQTKISFSDGLGRTNQSIVWKGSPDKTKDILTGLSLFDAYGRGFKQILPTPSDVATGAFRSTAETLANTFYADTAAHSKVVFEPSPLNRPEKQYGAGQAWRVADKYVSMAYLLAGSGILKFDIQSNGTVSCGTSYGPSTLLNYCTRSERDAQTYELKDKLGRVTHKFQQMETDFAVTAYCYNSSGFLAYVISPEAYRKMGTGLGLISSFTENDVIFKELCFGYHYDKFGKITERHVPGAGWEYSVYDKQDRRVYFADEADLAKGYWHFTQFDNLFRPIRKGIKTGMGSVNRSTLQTAFDNMTTETYEERGTTLLGYTNRSFPTTYQIADADVRTVFYYDDLLWNTDALYNFQSTNAFYAQGFTKGLMTGKLVRNIKTNTWQKMVMHYDYRGKLIQDFHLTNLNKLVRKDYQYRFNGELLKLRVQKKNSANVLLSTKIFTYSYDHEGRKIFYAHNGKPIVKLSYDDIGRLNLKKFSPSGTTQGSKQTGNWTDANNWLSGTLPTLADNVTINTGQTLTIPTGESAFAGILNDKGILKNFGTLNMGKATSADLYSESYSWHIRGGLRGKNLDANGDLTNTLFSYKLEYEGNNGFFDGNIRNQYWKSNIDGVQRAFEYNYDIASRLISASYGRSPQGSENYALNNVSYDFNGNITALSRNGATNSNFTSFANVDNLNYTYQSNSNKLSKIADATTGNTDLGDFRDGTNINDDYEYWEDGSLKRDRNKGIDSLKYNYLKLIERVKFSSGRAINYEYDAEGMKLKKIDSNGETTDYEEDEIYVNNVLYQTSHDEGRINAQGQYEYNITDHLGNLRVSFRDSSGVAVPVQSIFYDPFGLSMKGMQVTRNVLNFNKFQYNGKEIQLETGFIDLGNRSINPTIGRMLSIDRFAEKYSNLSGFQFAGNNPILNIDVNGDSITLSKEFQNNKYAMTAFRTFSQTNVGKRFLKDFGIGGKFEAVNVVFGLSNSFGSGTTQTFAEDKEGNESQIVAKEDQNKGQNQLTSLPKNSSLKFYVNLRWGGIEIDSEKENPLSFYDGMKKIIRGETLVHETQHVRIDTYDLLSGKKAKSNYEHHAIMKATDGIYFQERVGYYNQFISKFIKQEGSYDKANKTIRIMANDFNY